MKWNKVKDKKKPKDFETVLVWNEIDKEDPVFGWYHKETKYFYHNQYHDSYPIIVTHWMPIPATPND